MFLRYLPLILKWDIYLNLPYMLLEENFDVLNIWNF